MPPRPIGYNELVDQTHAQSAGYHIAMVVALVGIDADHAALGCWGEPGAPQAATCWDGSMDGLLDPSAGYGARPKYWALRWYTGLPAAPLRVSLSEGGECAGIAAVGGAAKGGQASVLLGRWSSRWQASGPAAKAVNLTLPPSEVRRGRRGSTINSPTRIYVPTCAGRLRGAWRWSGCPAALRCRALAPPSRSQGRPKRSTCPQVRLAADCSWVA